MHAMCMHACHALPKLLNHATACAPHAPWRAAGVIILPLLVLGLPETHQYRSLSRLTKRSPEAAAAVAEAPEILASRPVFRSPHYPLSILCERTIALHALVALLAFASMFCRCAG